MIKLIALSAIILSCTAQTSYSTENKATEKVMINPNDTTNSIHQFTVKSLDGGMINFSAFKGKKILVVNTASECGYTPQYKELQSLYEMYKNKLVVIGFPANNFGGQEPGSDSEIKSFCELNYGVTFPMAAKISVTGDDMAPELIELVFENLLERGTFQRIVGIDDIDAVDEFGGELAPDGVHGDALQLPRQLGAWTFDEFVEAELGAKFAAHVARAEVAGEEDDAAFEVDDGVIA